MYCFVNRDLEVVNCCLAGDPLYGMGGQPKCSDRESVNEIFAQDGGYERPRKPVPGDCGYHLHAHRVVFSHPRTNEMIDITAPLPTTLLTFQESKSSEKSHS
ncbi:hypothetical protein OROMI_010378 [Orobanche minor]